MPLIKKGGVPTRSIQDLEDLLNVVASGLTPNFKTAFQVLINSINEPSIKQQVIDHLYEYLNDIRHSSQSNTGRISILTILHHTNNYIRSLTGSNSLPTRRPTSSSRSSTSSNRSSISSSRSSTSSNRSSTSSNRSYASNNNNNYR